MSVRSRYPGANRRRGKGANLDPKNRKRQMQLSLAVVAAAVVLGAAFAWEAHKKGFDWERLRDILSGLELSWLLLAGFIAILTYVGRALRWRVLLEPVCPCPNLGPLIASTMIGFAAVTVLGRPGEFIRPYLIAKQEDVPFSSQLAAWVVERIYDLLVALLLFGFALSQLHIESSTMNPGPAMTWVIRIGGWVVLGASLFCLGLLVSIRAFSEASRENLLKRLRFLSERHLGRAEQWAGTFVRGTASIRSAAATLKIAFWSVLEWVLIGACYACILRSFGGELVFSWRDVVILMGFVSFGCLIQIPGVGGGVQVVGVIVLTEIFGLPLETATSVAVLIWLITFVLIVPIGVGLAIREGLTWATLKAARQEAIS